MQLPDEQLFALLIAQSGTQRITVHAHHGTNNYRTFPTSPVPDMPPTGETAVQTTYILCIQINGDHPTYS